MFEYMQDTKLADMPLARTDATRGAKSALAVNGAQLLSSATNLADLLSELGYGDNKVATAVNGDFVPERLRAGRNLAEGDQIEIVAPRQGG